MDTQPPAPILILLDPMFATTATVDILVLVVLIDPVRVVVTGVELNLVAVKVSAHICTCDQFSYILNL